MPMGNKYGTHRVVEPAGAMPQTAQKLNNDMSIVYDNEILLDVTRAQHRLRFLHSDRGRGCGRRGEDQVHHRGHRRRPR